MSAFGGRREGETESRTEEGKGETNGCKMEKRNGFIAATDATNNRASPAATHPAALLIPSGQIREGGGEGRGAGENVWEGSFLKLDRDLRRRRQWIT